MIGRGLLLAAWLCILMTHPGQLHAATSDAAAAGATSMDLDEVQVIGKKLYQLQRELVQAQDHFYALYNQLNTKRDFNIHCALEAPTGTRIRQRICRIQFLEEVETAQAQALLGIAPSGPTDPMLVWLLRQKEYRDNARALLLAHPELRNLAQQWQQAQTDYDTARKNRLKDKKILFE